MLDVFAQYEGCLEEMQRRLGPEHQKEFHVLRSRLIENLSHARLYGDTPTRQSDRSMVLDTLNRLAQATLGMTFDSITKPAQLGASTSALDVIVYVALGEEFSLALKHFGKGFIGEEAPDLAVTVYRGKIPHVASQALTSVLIVPGGSMGNTRSSNLMSAFLSKHSARNVVALGIAGSIGDDLQLGDVFIPHCVNEYMANAAGVGSDALTFIPSGNRLPTDPRLLNRTQFFHLKHAQLHQRWRQRAVRSWKSLVNTSMHRKLKAARINLRGFSKVISVDDRILGSGPAVSKGLAFAQWLRQTTRKTEAVEMESAGVLDAACVRSPAPLAYVIRGISDYGDDRKNVIETATKGAFRKLAIYAATSYLVTEMRAGLFSS